MADPSIEEQSVACRNCDASLHGPFCSACGQEAKADPTFGGFVRALAAEVVDVDSRAARSFRLLLRPGALPREWRAGRRVRYLPPARLYLVASVVFFFLMALAPAQVVNISYSRQAAQELVRTDTPAAAPQGWNARLAAAARDPDRINELWMSAFAWTLFMLVPVFAMLLALLFGDRDMLYAHHLVFALHFHAFAFLTMAAGFAGMHLPLGGDATTAAWVLAPHPVNGGYLLLAMRRFYGREWWGTIGRGMALGFGYALALVAGALATFAVATLAL